MTWDEDPPLPSRRSLLLGTVTASALPFLALAYVSRRARAAPAEIVIDDFEFRPGTLSVPAGTTVAWVNHDGSPHNVVSQATPRVFRSRLMEQGDRFEFTFATPGTYGYYCALHPHMLGSVVVT